MARFRRSLTFPFLLAGCLEARSSSAPSAATSGPLPAASLPVPTNGGATEEPSSASRACAAEWATLSRLPVGWRELEGARAHLLGRARGEPGYFIRAPTSWRPAEAGSARVTGAQTALVRLNRLVTRYAADPSGLRAQVLREGYLVSEEPLEAVALSQAISLRRLFDEPELYIQRGLETRRAERRDRPLRYAWANGPDAGEEATLLLGDRVAVRASELGEPLHRDVTALADELGFDRARVRGGDATALALDVRVAGQWRRVVARAAGARLSAGCWAEVDGEALAARARGALRFRAMPRVRAAVSELTREGLRFDRPQGEKTAERDGHLRPAWWQAYKRGGRSFSVDGEGYPVFDALGRPHPPEVCVDFVLDSFERASGTWFEPLGRTPGRVLGSLDWDPLGGRALRGVLALYAWAEKSSALFEAARFPEPRVPFAQRGRFLGGLVDEDARDADPALRGPTRRFDVEPGDIVAIHGEKSDGLIHQHAILVERVDPLTGLPSGLADQMKKPRRRTWEGIMAEAPKRSLLYRIRPTDEVWRRLLGEAPEPTKR